MKNDSPTCRASGSTDLHTILDFGLTPLADQLREEHELDEEQVRYPLRLVFCPESALVQTTEDVPPEVLYGNDYPYYTSVLPALVRHFTAAADSLLARKPLGSDSLVIEAASNDGYQLQVFHDLGIPVLGIDPAQGPAAAANSKGIETLCRFFDAEVAAELHAQGRRADLITGNNVLNLLQDLPDFMRAIDLLLAPDGLICIEVPYVVDTIDQTAFDNVFHQNTTYWSATSLDRAFRRYGFYVNHVERIPTFGGSLRVYIEREERQTHAALEILEEEQERGVDTFAFYAAFAERVESLKRRLRLLIDDLRADEKRIIAYGAAGGMATTLLSYLDLDEGDLEYAVDLSPHKHGRYTSGAALRIEPVELLVEDRPDYALLLAWNHADEILAQQDAYRAMGGQFIVPIPAPRVA
ncbi:MAG: class I SAM-dependent methyltransferase [bacterium]|nr:class I SAM-dependent methyltransferase [bacterium]